MRPVSELVRPSYRAIAPYTSNREPVRIDLSDNRNQLGPAPSAAAALSAGLEQMAHYPSHYSARLKDKIADYLGVRAEHVVTGCGSDDVLDSAVRAFAAEGESITFSEPTFAMIPHLAVTNALSARPLAFDAARGWDIDAEALLAERAKITYVCSPNNPTGTLASPDAIERVIAGAEGLVILDEAYAEFHDVSYARRATEESSLLVVRTFSKAFGLAGMRIGYGIGSPELVAEIEKSRGPYKVGVLSERAACAALEHDLAWMRDGVAQTISGRDLLTAWLRGRGHAPVPSQANFVLVPVSDAQTRAKQLRELGVAVRPFTKLRGFGDAIRISVGPAPLMREVIPMLAEVL